MDTSTLSRQDTEDYLLTVSKLEASVYMQEKFVDDLNQRNAKLKKEYQEEENAELPVAELPEKEGFWYNLFISILGFLSFDFHVFSAIFENVEGFFSKIVYTFVYGFVHFLFGAMALPFLAKGNPALQQTLHLFVDFELFPSNPSSNSYLISIDFWLPIFVFWLVVRLVLGLIWGVISGIRGLVNNKQEYEQYQRDLVTAHRAQQEHQKNLQRLSTELANMNAWVSAARDSLQKSKAALAKAYSYDIIHPKYRNLVAVYTMYEYYQSGRCSVLTGHEGAYNLYENESRQNHIISMLGQINERLDGMEKNQYYLWSAIKETQSSLSSLSSRVNRSMNTLSAKVESAKYSAELAEQNTRTMLYLDTLRSK